MSLELRGNKFATPIRRIKQAEVYEDPNQHLWAISYSDLLMVLLTFFVLFFSFGENSKQPLVDKIKISFEKVGKKGKQGVITGSATPEAEAPRSVSNVSPGLAEKLKDLDVSVATKVQNEKFVIDFPDDFYSAGKYELNAKQKKELARVLAVVREYDENIHLTFIGHTDEVPVAYANNKVINSNLVLSNLRAARAVEVAWEEGFSPKYVFSQGAGEQQRKTRSLSLEIRGRENEK